MITSRAAETEGFTWGGLTGLLRTWNQASVDNPPKAAPPRVWCEPSMLCLPCRVAKPNGDKEYAGGQRS